MEAFREGRDPDGWRLDNLEMTAKVMDDTEATSREAAQGYPIFTPITEELVMHIQALLRLFDTEAPLALPLRPTDKQKLRYTGGDASAEGLSWATQYPDGSLEGRDGLWAPELATGSSNLREAQNQVNHLLSDI